LADKLLRTGDRRNLGRGERILAAPLVLHATPLVRVDLLDANAQAERALADDHAGAAVDAAADGMLGVLDRSARLEAALPSTELA
jgi:hypothetical protein